MGPERRADQGSPDPTGEGGWWQTPQAPFREIVDGMVASATV